MSSHAAAPTAAAAADTSDGADFYTPVYPAVQVQPLRDMGFPEARCVRALHATGGVSIDAAVQWLFDHADDTTIDTPLRLPRAAAPAAAATASDAAAASTDPNQSANPIAASSTSAAPSTSTPLSAAAAAIAGGLASLFGGGGEPYKLVLVVRRDLGMRAGKIAAQCAHAAVGTVLDMQTSSSGKWSAPLTTWLEESQAKVVVSCKDEAEMISLHTAARAAGIHTHIVRDAGRTQVEAGSRTVLAVGPAPISKVNAITGHLKLL